MQESKAVVATDTSDKNREMRGRQIISNKHKIAQISRELYDKKWKDNTSGVDKVIILLELITVLEIRGKYIEHRKIEIGFDNII